MSSERAYSSSTAIVHEDGSCCSLLYIIAGVSIVTNHVHVARLDCMLHGFLFHAKAILLYLVPDTLAFQGTRNQAANGLYQNVTEYKDRLLIFILVYIRFLYLRTKVVTSYTHKDVKRNTRYQVKTLYVVCAITRRRDATYNRSWEGWGGAHVPGGGRSRRQLGVSQCAFVERAIAKQWQGTFPLWRFC